MSSHPSPHLPRQERPLPVDRFPLHKDLDRNPYPQLPGFRSPPLRSRRIRCTDSPLPSLCLLQGPRSSLLRVRALSHRFKVWFIDRRILQVLHLLRNQCRVLVPPSSLRCLAKYQVTCLARCPDNSRPRGPTHPTGGDRSQPLHLVLPAQ